MASKTYCVVWFYFFVLCNICCQYLWLVNFWLPLRCSKSISSKMERNPFTEITVVMYTCTIKSQYDGHSRVPENVPAMNSFHLFIGYNYVQYLLLMWKIRLPFIDSVLLYIAPFKAGLTVVLQRKMCKLVGIFI
jgi:hypothetical protein